MQTFQAVACGSRATTGPRLASPAGRRHSAAKQTEVRAQAQEHIQTKFVDVSLPNAPAMSVLSRGSIVRGGVMGLVGTLIAISDAGKAAYAKTAAAAPVQAPAGIAPVGFTLPQAREAAGQALQTLRDTRQELIQIRSCPSVDKPNECLDAVTAGTTRAQLQNAEDAGRTLVKTLPVLGAEVAMHPSWSSSLSEAVKGEKSQVVTGRKQAVESKVKGGSVAPADTEWYTEAVRMTDAAVLAASALSGLASRAIEGGKPTAIVEGTTNEIAAAGTARGSHDLVATLDGPLLQAALDKLEQAISSADALLSIMPAQM